MPNLKYPIVNGTKLCAECLLPLPVAMFRKARRHLTTRCIPCLKKYAEAYRQRPEVKKHQLAYSQKYRAVEENRLRLNEHTRKCRSKPKSKIKRNKNRREWIAKEKQKAIEYKGGKCICCGYSRCQAALDFHHLDPSQKEGYKSGAIVPHWTFERNKAELDKCVLVCVRCHREIHAGVRILEASLYTSSDEKSPVKEDECKNGHITMRSTPSLVSGSENSSGKR